MDSQFAHTFHMNMYQLVIAGRLLRSTLWDRSHKTPPNIACPRHCKKIDSIHYSKMTREMWNVYGIQFTTWVREVHHQFEILLTVMTLLANLGAVRPVTMAAMYAVSSSATHIQNTCSPTKKTPNFRYITYQHMFTIHSSKTRFGFRGHGQ